MENQPQKARTRSADGDGFKLRSKINESRRIRAENKKLINTLNAEKQAETPLTKVKMHSCSC